MANKKENVMKGRKVKNTFHLQDSIKNVLYSSPDFVLEETVGEIIRFKKTKITFNPLHSSISSSWTTPEVDTVDLVFTMHSEYADLFSSLKEKGYSSPLIDLFAWNEKYKIPFKDPEFNDILITKTTGKRKDTNSSREEEKKMFYYHLEGGSLIFHRILEKDPAFW